MAVTDAVLAWYCELLSRDTPSMMGPPGTGGVLSTSKAVDDKDASPALLEHLTLTL